MNIIIVGCGKVGQTLIEQLNVEGNLVTVIDRDAEKISSIVHRFDVMGIVGNGATHAVLDEAGIDRADLLIAVTGSDEYNLLFCLLAKKNPKIHTIARVKSPDYSNETTYFKEQLGLAMIVNQEFLAAEEISRVLRFPSALKIDTFAGGRVELMQFRLPRANILAGMSVKNVMAEYHSDILFCSVEREEGAFIAKGDFIFRPNDIISIIATPKNATEFFRKIQYKTNAVKNVMIVGGGEMTHYLCNLLTKTGISVKVIEKNKERCEEICTTWPGVTVIHADATDQIILMEEGLASAGALVALTDLDEENILLSLFAKRESKGKVVTKITRIDFDDVIKHLDLDTTIYPKNITAEKIARYVRAMENTLGSNVETMYSIVKGKIEASEFIVREESGVTGVPLMKLASKFKNDILIASIIRGNQVIIPRGGDEIRTGDDVVVISSASTVLHDITDILR